jgi:segregation and condensation protein B
MTDSTPREKNDEDVSGKEPGEETEQSEDALADDGDSAQEEITGDGDEMTVESVAEAVLFASDEPLSADRLAGIIGAGTVKDIRKHINNLNARYEAGNFAFRIEQIAGGYQMMTLSRYNHWLKKLLRARTDTKLSQAALETLAIIAYKQPIMRADIEAIRGVAAGEMIRGLMYKGLVRIVGRAEVLGRPMLYGTTKKFLEVFGLNTIKDLPKVEELKKPDQ